MFVEPPLPGPLASRVASIPYRVENLRILTVGGPVARNVSPRVGHLHITVDDLPCQWVDYGQSNTIILVNPPRREHKVLIEVVDPEGRFLTADRDVQIAGQINSSTTVKKGSAMSATASSPLR